MVPLELGFDASDTVSGLPLLIRLGEVVFFLDAGMCLATTYPDERHDVIVTERALLASHYLRTWALVDGLSVSSVALRLGGVTTSTANVMLCIKTLKLRRLLRLGSNLRVGRKRPSQIRQPTSPFFSR